MLPRLRPYGTDILSVDLLPQLYPMDSAAMVEYNNYKDVKTILSGLINDNRNILQLDSTEIDILDNIANASKGLAGTEARNILTFGYGYGFIDCAENLPPIKDKKITDPVTPYKVFEPEIFASPNPANEWTAFHYTLPLGTNSLYIKIINMNGQTITTISVNRYRGQVIWDTRNIAPGVYCFTLINEKYSKSGKITVIH